MLPVPDAQTPRPTKRKFIGVAFRAQAQSSKFEYIYLRTINGRADDQLQRNHSVTVRFSS
jgi:hypothetical protein